MGDDNQAEQPPVELSRDEFRRDPVAALEKADHGLVIVRGSDGAVSMILGSPRPDDVESAGWPMRT